MNATNQIPKRIRRTLNKQIAAAPTHAKKWEIALHGGNPPSAIQRLPSEAFGLHKPSLHGAEWQAQAIQQAKVRFADLLFPALMTDDPKPFEELLAAMAHRRKTEVSLDEFIRRQKQARKKKPSKKESGRKLRLALLNLRPDDLTSLRAVMNGLHKYEVEYSDESHVRRVMREMDVHLLKPGDTVYFHFSEFDLLNDGSKKWLCLRKLVIQQNGIANNYGMSRKEYDDLNGRKAHRVDSAAPDK